jgi:integrase
MLGSLITAYRWAERGQVINLNPLNGIRKPPKASRGAKALVSAGSHARLTTHATPFFKAFLQLLWLTGARPGEIASLTAFCIDLAQGIAVLTEHHKTAHLGKVRIVYLCPEAVAILRERISTASLTVATCCFRSDSITRPRVIIGQQAQRQLRELLVRHCSAPFTASSGRRRAAAGDFR